MNWSDYWGALGSRQRIGLLAGAVIIVVAMTAFAVWLLHDPYVPLAAELGGQRLNELTQELDRAKIDYRIGEGADSVTVPRSELGKARAAVAGGQFGVPPSVGLELFKETDFSATDFAQKVNYQRALQGELTRTIQTIAGVRSARVHVILADGGLFKRNAAKASAAVSVALQPGKELTVAQVRGIQRLVAASVPEIKMDDVVVLDESGASLTRPASTTEGELSSAQLDLKRQADQYLEGKLLRLLQDLVPQGVASLSVDAVLDERQLKVTTDEPIATRASGNSGHAAGVLVKERQSQRGMSSGFVQASGDAGDADSTDWEYEYAVGRRMEQTLSNPGSIKRLSVAVALQGAPSELTSAAVEKLVANAVGIEPARGDSLSVLLLERAPAGVIPESAGTASLQPERAGTQPPLAKHSEPWEGSTPVVALIVAMLGLFAMFLLWARLRAREETHDASDVDAMTAKVRQWLQEGAGNGRT